MVDESLVSAGSPAAEPRSLSQSAGFIQADGSGDCVNLLIYPYERLSVISSDPVAGIDVTKREVHTHFPSNRYRETCAKVSVVNFHLNIGPSLLK